MQNGAENLRAFSQGEQDDIAAYAHRSGWRLDFGGKLELDYDSDHRARAVKAFRFSSVFILLIYLLLSSGIYLFMPEQDVVRWLSLYGWVGVIVILAGLMSRISLLDNWFAAYAGVGCFGSVALSVAVTGVVRDPVAGQLTQAAIMYAMVIIYGVVGLRFKHALYAGWLGGLAGTVLALVLGGAVDWGLLHRTYTGSSLLGMYLAYYAERRDREMYIQARLLQLANDHTAEYAGQLDRLARQDSLTGIANRRHFDEEMQKEWRRAARQQTPIAVLMIDIDHFKHYNDTLGHVAGDHCLRQVASLIASHARRPGELAVRYGGEEFLLMFPETGKEAAMQVAERLLQSFRDARLPQAPGLARSCVSISIGVAVAMPDTSMVAPGELVCAADDALYEAKHAGRDAWRYAAGISLPGDRDGMHSFKPESV